MPILLTFTFKDGTSKEVRIPAEIWRRNDKEVSKVFFFKKELAKVEIDKHLETADVDTYNNNWPTTMENTMPLSMPTASSLRRISLELRGLTCPVAIPRITNVSV